MMQAVFWQVGQLFMSWPVLYELRLQEQRIKHSQSLHWSINNADKTQIYAINKLIL